MKKLIKPLLPVLALFIFSFPGISQPENHNATLWKISGNGLKIPSYLFGTIHLPKKQFIEFSEEVYAAILNSEQFFTEIDFSKPTEMYFMDEDVQAFFIRKMKHLDSLTKTTSWKRFIDRVNKAYNTSIDAENMNDWVTFSQKLAANTYSPDPGVDPPDLMLTQFAVSVGKKAGGLETFISQFEMLYKVLDAKVADSTVGIADETTVLDRMQAHYLNERMDSISLLLQATHPAIKKWVFDDRNITMTDSMLKHMNEGSAFFAVGFGHLAGPEGIISLLRTKGYVLTPVRSKNRISMKVMIQAVSEANKKFMSQEDFPPEVEMLQPPTELPEGIKIEAVPPPPPPKKKGKG